MERVGIVSRIVSDPPKIKYHLAKWGGVSLSGQAAFLAICL